MRIILFTGKGGVGKTTTAAATAIKAAKQGLKTLVISGVDNLMHESFSVSNPKQFTRSWFAWANSFFGETILTLLKTKPHLVK